MTNIKKASFRNKAYMGATKLQIHRTSPSLFLLSSGSELCSIRMSSKTRDKTIREGKFFKIFFFFQSSRENKEKIVIKQKFVWCWKTMRRCERSLDPAISPLFRGRFFKIYLRERWVWFCQRKNCKCLTRKWSEKRNDDIFLKTTQHKKGVLSEMWQFFVGWWLLMHGPLCSQLKDNGICANELCWSSLWTTISRTGWNKGAQNQSKPINLTSPFSLALHIHFKCGPNVWSHPIQSKMWWSTKTQHGIFGKIPYFENIKARWI